MTETTKQPKAGDQPVPKSKIKANDKSAKTPKTGAVAAVKKPGDFPFWSRGFFYLYPVDRVFFVWVSAIS